MNTVHHVWAGSTGSFTLTTSPWWSTLVDIVDQWGWLLAIVLLGSLLTIAFGDHRPDEEG